MWGVASLVAIALISTSCAPGASEQEAALAETIFEEAEGASDISFVHRNGMTGETFFVEMMAPGAALFDADGDGDLDAYLVQGRSLGEGALEPVAPGGRLFMNGSTGSGDLSWVDETESRGVRALEYGTGVAVADVDNDGDLDLYLSNFGANQLFLNDGDGAFKEVEGAGGAVDERWSASAAFFDYDRDGDLDLYVTNYVDFTLERPKVCSGPTGRPDYCSPNSYRGEPDSLFRNRGNGTFENVTVSAGIARQYGNGLGVIASDLDRDGFTDLYVANDLEPNIFWRNQGDGTFANEAMLFGIAVNSDGKAEAGMGLVAADLDNDGFEDLFLTHLAGETNTLYQNQEARLFLDETQSRGLALPSVGSTGFGVVATDVDNDGFLDLAVANGAVTIVEEQALAGSDYPMVMSNQLFLQRTGRFVERALLEGEAEQVSRGIAAGDVDNDGDTDLLVMNNHGKSQLLLNRLGSSRPWVGFRLVETLPNGADRDVYGARLKLDIAPKAAAGSIYRRVSVDGGYLSSHDPRILVGLGTWVKGKPLASMSFNGTVCWVADECQPFSVTGVAEYHTIRRSSSDPPIQGGEQR